MSAEYWRHLQMRVDRLEQQWDADEGNSGAEVRSFVTERAVTTPPRATLATLCYGKRQPAVRPAPGRRLDHNVDIPAQSGQAFQQTVLRNPAKPPFQEG